ncbi:MAG: hypothetical protein WBI82_01715 [Sphaerochaeta sp.]
MPPLPSQGAMYLTLLSPHSLGNGTMVMLLLLSLRWGMKATHPKLNRTNLVTHDTLDKEH